MKTFSFHNHRTFQIIRAYQLSILLKGKSCRRKFHKLGGYEEGLWSKLEVQENSLPILAGILWIDWLIKTRALKALLASILSHQWFLKIELYQENKGPICFWVMRDQIPNHHHQTSNCPMDEPNLLTSTTCSQLSKWRNVENMGTIFLFFYFLMDNRKQGYYINPIHEKKLCMISLQG